MKTSFYHWILAGFAGAFLAVVPLARAQFAAQPGIAIAPAEPAKLEKGPLLGLSTERVTATEATDLKLPNRAGVRVTEVAADSPAEKAGLKKGDIIDKFDDQLLVHPAQLIVLVSLHKADDKIKLGVVREDKHLDITATISQADVPPLEEQLAEAEHPGMQITHDGQGGMVIHQNGPNGQVMIQVGAGGGFAAAGGAGAGGFAAGAGGGMLPIPPMPGVFPQPVQPAPAPAPAGPVDSSWSDEKHAMILTTNAGKPVHLVIKDKSNNDKVIFDADVATEDQQKAIPDDLQAAFKTLLETTSAPAPDAATGPQPPRIRNAR